eukprot:TRINITY_DN2820_c0_g1_i1.p1 TRINITY_DN2820_c0_g1~~TRINITY_DN2820_c0_g1_i1.p1  ORF type:complete len:496 (+),score=91.88 TRINITY_DN2820_c0_g1_i1:87-1490(+)
MEYIDVNEIENIHKSLKDAFSTEKTLSYEWRVEQLNQIIKMLNENKKQFADALGEDLSQVTIISDSEINGPISEAQYHLSNLSSWMKPSSKSLPKTQFPGSAYIVPEPYGTVLIISPWNYPISLLLKPLIGAISAGNTCLLKPSEVSLSTSHVLYSLIPKYLDNSCIKIVLGGPAETEKILTYPFDYIFYTGSTNIGKKIMRAASEFLTPVTLELGGKSPVIIDETANMSVAAKRIVWGKFTCNAGQTCVAPDYILCVGDQVKQKFTKELVDKIHDFYGKTPDEIKQTKDFPRIINQRHTNRLKDLVERTNKEDVIFGGEVDLEEKYISPTLLTAKEEDEIMKEEIFGPLLPILTVDTVAEAVKFVKKRSKPLALYVFSESKENVDRIINGTSSGAVSVNEVVMHVICKELEFGGVGDSGMGSYNGKKSFDTFSHRKSVLKRPTWGDVNLRYPPYTEKKLWWLGWLN